MANSAQLQKLESVCRQLPYFGETVPGRKSISRKLDVLYYYYKLSSDFEEVNKGVSDYLEERGWRKTKTESGVWENQIEFEKDHYWVRISHGNFGDSNYATNCLDKEIAKT